MPVAFQRFALAFSRRAGGAAPVLQRSDWTFFSVRPARERRRPGGARGPDFEGEPAAFDRGFRG